MRRGVAAIPHAPNARDMTAPRSAQRHHSNRWTPKGLTNVDSLTARAHGLPNAPAMATSLDIEIAAGRPSIERLHVVSRRARDRERWLRRLLNTAVAAAALFVYLREQIEGYQRRQRVRPGITGWAQVNQGYDRSVDDVRRKVAFDLEYIRRQSASEDLRIMLRTIPVMLLRRGGW